MTNLLIGYPHIPQEITWAETNRTFTDNNPVDNIRSGERYQIAKLSSASSDLTRINYSVPAAAAANYVAIARADMLKAANVNRIIVRGGVRSGYYPNVITGLKAWFDLTRNYTKLYGKYLTVNDSSTNGYLIQQQGADSTRPLITRGDNKENFITYSEQFSFSTAWDRTSYPVSVVDNHSNDYLGNPTAALMTASAGVSRHGITWTNAGTGNRFIRIAAGSQWIYEIELKAGTHSYAWCGTSADSPWHGVSVNLSNGTFNGAGGNLTNKTITSLGNGWYLITLTITATAEHLPDLGVWFATSANDASPPSAAVSAGTETLYLARARSRRVSADSDYIKTYTYPELMGVNGNKCSYLPKQSRAFSSTYYPTIAGGFSIAAVVRPSCLHTGMITCCYDGTTAQRRFQFQLKVGGEIEFIIQNGSSDYIGRTTAASTYAANTTYILVATYDGGTASSGIKIYLNSVNQSTTDLSAGAYTVPGISTTDVEIGASSNTGNTFFGGEICEVIFYEKELNSSEAGRVYTSLETKYLTAPVFAEHNLSTKYSYDEVFDNPKNINGLIAWFDPTKAITTDADNGVSSATDQSGNGNDFSQSTAGSRPALTREDNKENLFTYSEAFDNAVWTPTRASISANTVANPINGATDADTLVEDASAATTHFLARTSTFTPIAYMPYVFSVYAKRINRDISLRFEGSFGSGFVYAHFNLGTGAVTSVDAPGSATIESIGSGWYRCSLTCDCTSTPSATNIRIGLTSPAGTASYTGTSSDGAYIWGAQLRLGKSSSDYIKTLGYNQYPGINGKRCIYLDGTADHLRFNGIADDLSGEDIPFTLFIAYRTNRTTGTNQTLFNLGDSAQAVQKWHDLYILNNYRLYRRADAGAAVTASRGETNTSTTILSHKFAGTNASIWVDSNLVMNEDTLNVGTVTFDRASIGAYVMSITGEYFDGYICEVLVYNVALSDKERQSVESYLANKWQNSTDTGETLYGSRGTDFYETFTTSGQAAQWWVDYDQNGSGYLEHSKFYVGSYFDFGFDPDDLSLKKIEPRTTKQYAASGAVHFGKSAQNIYELEATWKRVTDAKVTEFETNVVSDSYRKKGVFLFTTTDHSVLDEKRILHMELLECVTESEGNDLNTVRCRFRELQG